MDNLDLATLDPYFVEMLMANRENFESAGQQRQVPLPQFQVPIDPRDRNKIWEENGTSIQHLITPERADVRDWIMECIPLQGPVIIGISVEYQPDSVGDDKADVITLYVRGRCLSYQVSRDIICEEMLELLNNNNFIFVGKSGHRFKDMRELIARKQTEESLARGGGESQHVTMKNRVECGPAVMYLEEARHLVMEGIPDNWKARILTRNQARYTCLHALAGWLFARGRPPP